MTTLDMFPAAPPSDAKPHATERWLPGGVRILLIEGWMPRAEADATFTELRETVPWKQETIRIFGKTMPIPRLTAWFGDKGYVCSGITHTPMPWHPVVQRIRERVEHDFGPFNGCLLNLYLDGKASVGWHADDEDAIMPETTIVSVSLGASRRFILRHRNRRTGVEPVGFYLGDGALFMMGGGCQRLYEHCVPKEAGRGPRISLTFRRMR